MPGTPAAFAANRAGDAAERDDAGAISEFEADPTPAWLPPMGAETIGALAEGRLGVDAILDLYHAFQPYTDTNATASSATAPKPP
jgi:hypothetical protein